MAMAWPLSSSWVKIAVLNIHVGVLEREESLQTDGLELKFWILTKLFNLYFPFFKIDITILPCRAFVMNRVK